MRLSAVTATSGSANEVATEANENGHARQGTIPDEDPDDEAVDERNVMAEVTLPSTVRKSYLLSVLMQCYQSGFFLRRTMDSRSSCKFP